MHRHRVVRGDHDHIIDAENRVTASRRFYNLAVEEYGITLRQFPGSYIARLRKMSVRMPFDLGIERVLVDDPYPDQLRESAAAVAATFGRPMVSRVAKSCRLRLDVSNTSMSARAKSRHLRRRH